MREEAHHTAIPVEERVDPGEAMVRRARRDDAVERPERSKRIRLGETAQKRGQALEGGRNMAPDLDIVVPQLAGDDCLRVTVAPLDDPELLWHPLVKVLVDPAEKVRISDGFEYRCTATPFADLFADVKPRKRSLRPGKALSQPRADIQLCRSWCRSFPGCVRTVPEPIGP
jgi:hypothetical protein